MENAKSTKSETKVSILNFLPNTLKNLSNTKQENMTTKVDDIMKEKFLCQSRFAEEVEKIVKANNFNYIDAIITFCEENKIEVDSVSKLISKPLKEKLKYDAQQLNFMKKTSRAKLPL
jgi:vacuolar-type H+-ATPase catalytic subunit A/Vma1